MTTCQNCDTVEVPIMLCPRCAGVNAADAAQPSDLAGLAAREAVVVPASGLADEGGIAVEEVNAAMFRCIQTLTEERAELEARIKKLNATLKGLHGPEAERLFDTYNELREQNAELGGEVERLRAENASITEAALRDQAEMGRLHSALVKLGSAFASCQRHLADEQLAHESTGVQAERRMAELRAENEKLKAEAAQRWNTRKS